MKSVTPNDLRRNPTLTVNKKDQEVNKLPSEVIASIPVMGENLEKVEKTPTNTLLKSTSSLSPISKSPLEKGWVRQDFPSGNLTYGNADIQVRPMDISVIKRLAGARAGKSFTAMIDALSSCINMDIRNLTVQDFYFFMYWLRINSYLKSPLNIRWQTKYGNERSFRITNTTLEVIELEIDNFVWNNYRERYTIPTIRDMEIMQNSTLAAAEEWEIKYSQYIRLDFEGTPPPDYMQQKIDLLNSYGPDALVEIDEFSKLINHGVKEIIEIADSSVDVLKSIDYLKEEVQTLTRYLAVVLDDKSEEGRATSMGITLHLEAKAKLLEDLEKFRDEHYDVESKQWKKEYVAEKEQVTIGNTDISLLFP
jgi:hypothetical protein